MNYNVLIISSRPWQSLDLVHPRNAEPLRELVRASGRDVDAAVAITTKVFKTGERATASGVQLGRWWNKLADSLNGEENEGGLVIYKR